MSNQRTNLRPAFSLAELMIAIVILGLGLLFIAAALPVGIEYSRRNVLRAEAEAAGQAALDRIEAAVFLTDEGARRVMFEPAPGGAVDTDLEPIIKVRPFTLANVQARNFTSVSLNNVGETIIDDPELAIRDYCLTSPGVPIPDLPQERYDTMLRDNTLMPGMWPLLPATERFYPNRPIVDRRGVQLPIPSPAFIENNAVNLQRDGFEQLDQRLAWTAFYRRVGYPKYDEAAPTTAFFGASAPVDGTGDENLYEIIVVVTQRPSENHRYPRQNLLPLNLNTWFQPQAIPETDSTVEGNDRIAPTPWLVAFTDVPVPPRTVPDAGTSANLVRRYVPKDAPSRATLRFQCEPQVGRLLPVGSVIIPARNDYRPTSLFATPGTPLLTGFTPSAPDRLPIYEVVDRPDAQTVVVRNDGMYPWRNFPLALPANTQSFPDTTARFPCWVIPPAFETRASDGTPVYENESPVVRVFRRLVRVPRVDP